MQELPPQALGNAWAELCAEVLAPGSKSSLVNLYQVLEAIPPEPGRQRPTADILTGIRRHPPHSTPSLTWKGQEGVLPFKELVAHLGRDFPRGHVGRLVLIGLLQGLSFGDIQTDLAALLPGYGLTADLLVLLTQRLREWQEYIEALSPLGPRPAPPTWGGLYLEIPGAAVARPELLTAAITLVEGWLAAAGLNDWVGLSAAEEPVLRAALLSVCLDLLVQSMHRCYRAHYQRRNSVLGGQ